MDAVHDPALAYHQNSTRHGLQKRLGDLRTSADDPTLLTVAALSTIDASITPIRTDSH